MTFKRGFKSWCEETAVHYRRRLALADAAPLDSFVFAEHLGVVLRTPTEFASLKSDVCQRLLTDHSDSWSAFTISSGVRPMIVYNPTHSAGRISSDLMHELAHIILDHNPSKMFLSSIGLPIRTHDHQQEEEATWLSGTLLLPRPALVRIKSRRILLDQAALEYGVSCDMVRYRLQVTGVNKIFSRIS